MISPNVQIPFATFDLNAPLLTVNSDLFNGLHFAYSRYVKPSHWEFDDSAEFIYQPTQPDSFIQLNYFLFDTNQPASATAYVDMIRIRFSHEYLQQFAREETKSSYSYSLLSFTQTQPILHTLELCHRTQQCIQLLRESSDLNPMQRMLAQAQAHMLLIYAIEDCMPNETDPKLVCKFLSNSIDETKIIQAKEILLSQLGSPITIKELSRKVALNECYLKKGFKEMMGCTIFEFYQRERMNHAQTLLRDKGLNVTEVADLLGYSSISHFSTAFKKQTGLKPCELLWR